MAELIDYTSSGAFGRWVHEHAGGAQMFSKEAGVNPVVIAGTDNFKGMCANLAFSLSLCSGQMCTAPQNLYIPRDGIASDDGHKSVAAGARGALTAAVYATDPVFLDDAEAAFAAAATNLSCNLTGGISVNQSAAFRDYHATGGNPAATACFTDLAFVANRFRMVAARRPAA